MQAKKLLKSRAYSSLLRPIQTQLSNYWSPHAAALEAEGQWKELFALSGLDRKDLQACSTLSARWKAALARAAVFLGERPLAETLIQELHSATGSLSIETQLVTHLAEAALLRQNHQWAEARPLTSQVQQMAREVGLVQLEADAAFAEALSLSEEGRVFLSIDLFQAIRNHPGQISQYRRRLATLNEIWCLWDTGQWEHMRLLASQVPAVYRPKIEVYLAALEGRADLMRRWIVHGLDGVEIPPSDLEQILLIFSEWQAIAPPREQISRITETWLYRTLQSTHSKATGSLQKKYESCLALLEGRIAPWPESGTDVDWRHFVEQAFLCLISRGRLQGDDELRLEYKDRLDRLLLEKRMKSPLIPLWSEVESEANPWCKMLAKTFSRHASRSNSDSLSHPVSSVRMVLKSNGTLSRNDDGRTLSFEKSPQTLALLRAIAGRKGKTLSKEELHLKLTGFAYRADLHDTRLHKLLRRTAVKIEQALGARPWKMPGNNTIELDVELGIE